MYIYVYMYKKYKEVYSVSGSGYLCVSLCVCENIVRLSIEICLREYQNNTMWCISCEGW